MILWKNGRTPIFFLKKNEGILTEPQVLRQAVIGILEFSAIEYFPGFSG